MKWKDTCARLIIQYATEKMTKEEQAAFPERKDQLVIFQVFTLFRTFPHFRDHCFAAFDPFRTGEGHETFESCFER